MLVPIQGSLVDGTPEVRSSSRSHRHRGVAIGGKRSHLEDHHSQAKGLLQVHTKQDGEATSESHPLPHAASWDGGDFWLATQHNRTLYFEPVAGLGNRLRGLGMPP